MEQSSLSIKHCMHRGYITFKTNTKLMIFGAAIYASPYFICIFLQYLTFGKYINLFINLVLSPVLAAGWWFLCLKLVREESVKLSDIFQGFFHLFKVWITFILTALIILVGFLLFIIPGVILTLKYSLVMLTIMDKKFMPHKSIMLSGKITNGYKMNLLILLLAGLIMLLLTWPFTYGMQNIEQEKAKIYIIFGLIPYIGGMLIVNPWLTATWATAYNILSQKYDEQFETDTNIDIPSVET